MADANAGLGYLTLLYIDWLAKQLLPDTAETEWLDRRGVIDDRWPHLFPKLRAPYAGRSYQDQFGADMAGIFTTIKRVLTGEVLRRIDTETMGGWCTMSLRLKRERSGAEYVVLAAIARGNNQYYAFELDEFDRFIEAAKAIRAVAQRSS